MNRSLFLLLAASLISTACAQQITSDPVTRDTALETELATLLRWLPGDYSSKASAQLPSIGHVRADSATTQDSLLTTHIRAVDLPLFGQHVLFLEEYRGSEAELERVRLYVFDIDSKRRAVSLRLLNPKNPDGLRGARDDLSQLDALTDADVTVDRQACMLFFSTAESGTVIGRMDSGACDVKMNWVDYELHVGPQGHWVCYSRRSKLNNQVTWQLAPPQPCILMQRHH